MRPPHRDCEREDEIVVLAGSGAEGEVPDRGELDPKVLQLADQRLGLRQLLLDLQPAFVQQCLEPRDERQFRDAADRAFPGLGDPRCDQHAERRNPEIGKHVENRPPDTGKVDHQLGSSRQFAEQPPDMRDDPGIRGAKRQAFPAVGVDRWEG
jgi:hypothetical protein